LSTLTPVDFTLGRKFSLDDLPQISKVIQSGLRRAFADKSDWEMAVAQVIGVGEEAGEFQQKFRRWAGLARGAASFEDMAEELADVVIFAFTAAQYLNINLPFAVSKKAAKVLTRGYKDGNPAEG
jgi:NTP pyrophosphatase (non-canonical NTP hydrolase)